jgi:hypothetical protein
LKVARFGLATSLLPFVLVLDGCRGDAPGDRTPDASLGRDASNGGFTSDGGADSGGSASGGVSTSSGGASNGGAASGGTTASGGTSPSGGTTSAANGGTDTGGSTATGGASGSCMSQVPCNPTECQNGATVCDGSGKSTCMHNGDVTDGTPCNMNKGVCSKGTCNACSTGADCTPSGSCQKMTIDCSSGAPVCKAAGNVTNGSPCGTNLYCNEGTCAPCTPNAPCVPTGKPCNNGVVSCSMGKVVCNDQSTPAQNGTSCGTNQVCSAGVCKACTANAVCTPTNACHVGKTTCDTGSSVCTDTAQSQQNNTPCTGTNKCNASYTCQSGTCTGSAPISCTALDSCHKAGSCDQSTGVCSNPTQPDTTSCGTNMACTSGKCQCATGYSTCNSACVDLQNDKANCGACGHDCIGGKCSAGACQKWLVGTDAGGPSTRIAADGTSVAWCDSTGLWIIPAAGVDNGKTARNLTTTFAPGMTFSNGRLIWVSDVLQQPQTTLSVVNASGGNIATSAAQNTGGTSLALTTDPSGSNAYFLDTGNNNPSFNVYGCSPISAGAACTKVAMGTGQDPGLAVGLPIGTYVIGSSSADFYFGAPSAVSRISLFGAAGATTPASTVNTVQAMANDGTNVFWMDSVVNTSNGTETFTIKKAPLSLATVSNVTTAAQSGLAIGSAMAVDSTYIYYVNSQSTTFSISPPTYIGYVPKAGGAAKPLYNTSNVIMGIAAAGGAVYWIEIVYNVATPSTSVYGLRFP